MGDEDVVMVQHGEERTFPLFGALVDCETLRRNRRGWVIVRDAIVEIELVGDWAVTDRGPRLSIDINWQHDLVNKDLAHQELMVQGRTGALSLGRLLSDKSQPTIRITDRFVVLQRTPSGHPDGRPDLRIRRG